MGLLAARLVPHASLQRIFWPQMSQISADEPRVNKLSERIIGCAFQVLNTLGPGFVEKVHGNALAHELGKCGLAVVQQYGIEVHYYGIVVGQHAVDLSVEETVVVELKAIKAQDDAHAAQCIHYLTQLAQNRGCAPDETRA